MATDAEELDKLPAALVALAEKLHPAVGEGSIFTEADYQMLLMAANDLEVQGAGRTAYVISRIMRLFDDEEFVESLSPEQIGTVGQINAKISEFASDNGYPQVMPVMSKKDAEQFVDDCAKIPGPAARHPFVRRLTGDDWAR